jgi:DNA (cytosine-5)-methyltransferase 1
MDYPSEMLEDSQVRAVGLFSGIGGFELGLAKAGISTELLCEYWEPAVRTLQRRFEAAVVGDVCQLRSLPACDVVTAGFPCTDLSQVGRTAGINGAESGLISEVFKLIEATPPKWVVLENVPNMLSLHGGAPIRHITEWFDDKDWNWAYRTVDSQHFGVRQRRRRVILVASPKEDPRTILFADEAPLRLRRADHLAYGFYWTEGNKGIGWGDGVTPTLKGGSKIGIASPPGVWVPGRPLGDAIARPSIKAGERLQGFPSDWTAGAGSEGQRWKLVGNAVTVPVSSWVGRRLVDPGDAVDVLRTPLAELKRWPSAAASVGGVREAWGLSERPLAVRARMSLAAVLTEYGASGLSLGATRGFATRLKASNLRSRPGFVAALDAHIRVLQEA